MGTHISPRREISPQQDLFPHLSWFSGAVGLYQIESSRVPSSARVSMQPGHGVCTPPLGLCCVGGQECCPCSIQGAADFSLQLPYCNLFTLTHLPIILHHTTSHLWRQKHPQTKQTRKTEQKKSHCTRGLLEAAASRWNSTLGVPEEKLPLLLYTSITWGQKAELWRQCHGIITLISYKSAWK